MFIPLWGRKHPLKPPLCQALGWRYRDESDPGCALKDLRVVTACMARAVQREHLGGARAQHWGRQGSVSWGAGAWPPELGRHAGRAGGIAGLKQEAHGGPGALQQGQATGRNEPDKMPQAGPGEAPLQTGLNGHPTRSQRSKRARCLGGSPSP